MDTIQEQKPRSHTLAVFFVLVVIIIAVLGICYEVFNAAPVDFPKDTTITVEKGMTLHAMSQLLEEKHVIKSALFFRIIAILDGGEKKVVEGDYFFKEPISTRTVASRITHGKYGIVPIKVTIPEGLSSFEIADVLANNFAHFDTAAFLAVARKKEGYLFPDTYLFFPKVKPEEIVKKMTDNFTLKTQTALSTSNTSTPKAEIVTLASIVEKEAKTTTDRKMIAGILLKRITIGMPLQVDVTFSYIYGTSTPQVYYKDLAVDSPYNLYKHGGLPPGPISNPGLDSIVAAANPVDSPYLYYLSDKNGLMHYAKTFEEHVRNKQKYLHPSL